MGPDGLAELNRQLLAEIDRHKHIDKELTRYRVLKRRAQFVRPEDHDAVAAIVADLAAVVA